MLQTQRIVCPSLSQPPRLQRGDEPFHCIALIWRDGERALVLLADRRSRNTGASVTNAIIEILLEQVLEPAGVPMGNVRWVERDSMGYFDELHVIDEWGLSLQPWDVAFSPCGERTLESFKNMAEVLGFAIDTTTVGQLRAVLEDADAPPTEHIR